MSAIERAGKNCVMELPIGGPINYSMAWMCRVSSGPAIGIIRIFILKNQGNRCAAIENLGSFCGMGRNLLIVPASSAGPWKCRISVELPVFNL